MTEPPAVARRRQRLEQLLAERRQVLISFAEQLGFTAPGLIADRPSSFIDGVGSLLRDQDLSDHRDLVWAMARLAYLIGEVVIEGYGGCWFLDETPGSQHYLEIVVGRFTRIADAAVRIDPFAIALDFLQTPPPRDLVSALDRLCKEIEAAGA